MIQVNDQCLDCHGALIFEQPNIKAKHAFETESVKSVDLFF